MRKEIKFRMWNPITSKMIVNLSPVMECLKQQIFSASPDPNHIPKYDHESDGSVFMQSTGLQDEIGNDIFEGDLIVDTGHIYQVHFGPYEYDGSNHTGFFTRNVSTGTISPIDSSDSGHVVIVGNIYQNPELLTVDASAGSGTENV